MDSGYNLVVLAFLVEGAVRDAVEAWSQMSAAVQQSTVNYAHSKGARIIIAAGGATDTPYGIFSGTAYGTAAANFAKNNKLDGVDFDLENFGTNFQSAGMSTANTIKWVVDATNAARSILGSSAIITHAPQTPYFGSSNGWADAYHTIYAQAPSINYFLVQYYNNGLATTYASIFTDNNGKTVTNIAAGGIPLNKIVVGKPVNSADGNEWISAATFRTFVTQAKTNLGWNGGVMGWQWHDQTTNTNWIRTIYP